jgi:hypothetical protein
MLHSINMVLSCFMYFSSKENSGGVYKSWKSGLGNKILLYSVGTQQIVLSSIYKSGNMLRLDEPKHIAKFIDG